MIYFDNSATTKPYKEVIETYGKVSEVFFGNPSSLHTLGKEAEILLDQGRDQIAKLLKVNKKEIIFTSGGTEGNNLAIKGTALQHQGRGKHVITTQVEHASNFEAYEQLEKRGFHVTYLNVNEAGVISIEELKRELRDDTILVSMIHVNNELGSIQPIREVGELLAKYPKVYFHVDHVQGMSKVPISIKDYHIDLLTISGHKFHGPKGTGVLYVRNGVRLYPLLTGGVQEHNLRAGTENIPGIIAMAKALRISMEKYVENKEHLRELRDHLVNNLHEIEGVIINSPMENSAPHIINFSIPKMKPEVVIQALGERKMYVSTKSACSSKLAEPSRVLMSTGIGLERAESAIRVSFSFGNTVDEVNEFILALKEIIKQLKEVMR
ncbi:cysteine desulfurase NifS [Anaerobacillus alkalidiazotrophicus]|uniref:Cysteine desulfurase NifS n=1 Tax=Anaerobacillus alkalidiazotrophicus TaxID=472963 RepID=A0A1S2M521_9BACI|nr:cysteine desulfurase family protein [Anaerobacillus alkalidiazotrophicus]OIJ18237.1 cysteine desulfurase NifS [Anaerobacillus alkalidiazotrophicus]OIJ19716.1 cysteine desulfurase NifS [Anaerobacillus alkalidiazotrophicus]